MLMQCIEGLHKCSTLFSIVFNKHKSKHNYTSKETLQRDYFWSSIWAIDNMMKSTPAAHHHDIMHSYYENSYSFSHEILLVCCGFLCCQIHYKCIRLCLFNVVYGPCFPILLKIILKIWFFIFLILTSSSKIA